MVGVAEVAAEVDVEEVEEEEALDEDALVLWVDMEDELEVGA